MERPSAVTAELRLLGAVPVDWAPTTLAVSTSERWYRLQNQWVQSTPHHRSNPAWSNKDQNQSAAPSSVTVVLVGATVTVSLATGNWVVSVVGREELIHNSAVISVAGGGISTTDLRSSRHSSRLSVALRFTISYECSLRWSLQLEGIPPPHTLVLVLM